MEYNRTLVVILGDTRATELTFDNFKKNVIDELHADLCLCLCVKSDYNYDNPFYKLSKFNFLYDEPDDFGYAFDYAYNIIRKTEDVLDWRPYMSLDNNFFGGVKHNNVLVPGGAGIVLFLRWFLLKNLRERGILSQYNRFVITRSDFIYLLPHPKLEYLDNSCVWFPNGEHHHGYTDRHAVLSSKNIETYLDIFTHMVIKKNKYYEKMLTDKAHNIECLIKFHLKQKNMLDNVKEFPYVMYLIRSKNGPTRWCTGVYNRELDYYIKYMAEYQSSLFYKDEFIKSGLNIDTYYKNFLNISNKKKKCIIITTINAPSSQLLSYVDYADWDLIVVGDSKTNDESYRQINCIYLGLKEQQDKYPSLYEKIPLNSYTRKMFGYLYAIENNYDIIYETDDDNKYLYPLDSFDNNYFYTDGKDVPGNDIKLYTLKQYDINLINSLMLQHKAVAFVYDKRQNNLWLKDKVTELKTCDHTICGYLRNVKYSVTQGFVNIYKLYSNDKIWPRGIPPGHQAIECMPILTDFMSKDNVAVIQGLVNNDPDVDAFYRINVKNGPFSFENDPGYDVIMNKYSVCPFNSQNTFWVDRKSFYTMYLPVSVTFRYTDILRGYIALFQLWKNNKTIKFTFPTAFQERNEHNLLKDYESEEPMYKTAEKVIGLLNNNKNATLEEVYEVLYNNDIIDKNELVVLKEWMNLVNKFI
jgi:hypothetical protein